jgi:hypothetical protein
MKIYEAILWTWDFFPLRPKDQISVAGVHSAGQNPRKKSGDGLIKLTFLENWVKIPNHKWPTVHCILKPHRKYFRLRNSVSKISSKKREKFRESMKISSVQSPTNFPPKTTREWKLNLHTKMTKSPKHLMTFRWLIRSPLTGSCFHGQDSGFEVKYFSWLNWMALNLTFFLSFSHANSNFNF